MSKLEKETITTIYRDDLRKLIVNQIIAPMLKNISNQMNAWYGDMIKIMEEGECSEDTNRIDSLKKELQETIDELDEALKVYDTDENNNLTLINISKLFNDIQMIILNKEEKKRQRVIDSVGNKPQHIITKPNKLKK